MSDRRDPQRRDDSARRAFIRANHPDVGGDPDAFIAGLAAFDGPPAARPSDSRARVVRSRRPDRLVRQTLRELRRRVQGKPPRNLK